MSGYSEYRHWNPVLGCDAARISMFDQNGREFWMLIEADDSKAYREARNTAVEAIATAIGLGLQPGEVRVQ